MRIGRLILFTRQSDGGLNLVTYHPWSSLTWYWGLSVDRDRMHVMFQRAHRRIGQWHDYVRLPFGWTLTISHQDYHREKAA